MRFIVQKPFNSFRGWNIPTIPTTSFKHPFQAFAFLACDVCKLTGFDGIKRDVEVCHGDLGAFSGAALQGGRGGGQRAEKGASWSGVDSLAAGDAQHWRALERPHLEERVWSRMDQWPRECGCCHKGVASVGLRRHTVKGKKHGHTFILLRGKHTDTHSKLRGGKNMQI